MNLSLVLIDISLIVFDDIVDW